MRIRIFFSVLIGTLLLFVWNVISWTALPFHTGSVNSLPAAALDTASIQQIVPYDGVYEYPGRPEENTLENWAQLEEQVRRGPRITLMVYKAGSSNVFDPKTLITDAVIDFLTVVLLLIILAKLQDKSAASIWSTCVIIGAIVGLISDFAQMNWYLFPLDYTVAKVFDHLIAFTLLGLFFGNFTFKNREIVK